MSLRPAGCCCCCFNFLFVLLMERSAKYFPNRNIEDYLGKSKNKRQQNKKPQPTNVSTVFQILWSFLNNSDVLTSLSQLFSFYC